MHCLWEVRSIVLTAGAGAGATGVMIQHYTLEGSVMVR